MGRKLKKEEQEDGPPVDAELVEPEKPEPKTEPAIVFPAVVTEGGTPDHPPTPEPGKPVATIQAGFTMKCNTCFLKDACSVFKPDSDCNLGIQVEMNDGKDVKTFMQQMLKMSAERVMRAYHFELANGGVISPEVKDAMSQFTELTQALKDLGDNRDTLEIKAKGAGIISKIFGGMGNRK